MVVIAAVTLDVKELWVSYGTEQQDPPSISKCLPVFHSLMGCDTTSFFVGHGKKTAWTAEKEPENNLNFAR